MTATEIESRKQEEERVRKENVRLEERTQIAQELHDTGIALDSPVKPQLDRIFQIMRQGIVEGRSAIQGLRSSGSQTSGLAVGAKASAVAIPGVPYPKWMVVQLDTADDPRPRS